jgi:serine/threonine protein kinase
VLKRGRWDPERIGPYAILGRLGTGAMGEVYLARSAAGRLVAVKMIKPRLAELAGFRTQFAQEVAAARRVSGVFTAPVVEADPDADLPWLATAYIPAPSLRDLVRECGALPVPTVRWLAAGCAEALASIHSAGLVHMDLKPSNVLVASDGPHVIDFGVARAVGRLGHAAAGLIGTPAYMAPEQARDASLASPASDVFALGSTLVYAATGHPPYHGETSTDVLVRLATEAPDLSGLPAALAPMVHACLNRVPRQRPSSATVLAKLGEFAGAGAYLPAPAQAMIRQYQRDPQAPPRADTDDDTAHSYPLLPAAARPDGDELPAWIHRLRRVRVSTRAVWAAAGALLVVVGVVLGTTLTDQDGGRPSVSSSTNVQPPPPLADAPQLGPQCGQQAATGPALCVVQEQAPLPGQGAVLTVRGSGFKPGERVTLTLTFYPPPGTGGRPVPDPLGKVNVVASKAGTFTHTYGNLSKGLYRVLDGTLAAVFRD